jgi:hypothetical protein
MEVWKGIPVVYKLDFQMEVKGTANERWGIS